MPYKKHHQVTIFVSPNSKFCELAGEYFRNAGIEYIKIDISRDENSRLHMLEISNQLETPVVELDGRVITGYRPEVYDIMIGEPDTKKNEDDDEKKEEDKD